MTAASKKIGALPRPSFAERTQACSLQAVRQLAAYGTRPLDQVAEEELCQDLLLLEHVTLPCR